MIPHLTPITTRAKRLTTFPPCALCGLHLYDCDCDPDEAMGAALAARMNVATAVKQAKEAAL